MQIVQRDQTLRNTVFAGIRLHAKNELDLLYRIVVKIRTQRHSMAKSSFYLFVVFTFLFRTGLAAEVSRTKLESALVNLRNDHIRYNCRDAYAFLVQHKEESEVLTFLRDKLATEEDLQARGAILSVLCRSRSYDHDEEFATAVLSYLIAYAEYLPTRTSDEQSWTDKYDHLYRTIHRVDLDCAKFLIRNARRYENLLQAHFDSGPIMIRWIVAHGFAKQGLLDKYQERANQEFYGLLFTNLRDDDQMYNALYATRILLIFGNRSIPFIQRNLLKRNIDRQEKTICRKILDGVSTRRNYAYFRYNIGDLYSDIWNWEGADDFNFQYELPIFSKLEQIDTSGLESEAESGGD